MKLKVMDSFEVEGDEKELAMYTAFTIDVLTTLAELHHRPRKIALDLHEIFGDMTFDDFLKSQGEEESEE